MKDEIRYDILIKDIGFNFNFHENDLKIIKQIIPKNDEELNFITKYSLYSYISWMACARKTGSPVLSETILSALNHILKFNQSKVVSHAFLYAFSVSVSLSEISEIKTLLPLLYQFFFQLDSIDRNFCQIFIIISDVLSIGTEDDQCEFIPFMEKIMSMKRITIMQETAEQLFNILKYKINQLELEPIKLFAIIMNSMEISKMITAIREIADILIKSVSEISMKIEENKEQLPFLNCKASATVALDFLLIDTYKDGFVLPETDFEGIVLDDPDKVFAENLDKKLDTVAKAATLSPDFGEEVIKYFAGLMSLSKTAVVFLLALCFKIHKNNGTIPAVSSFIAHSFIFEHQYFSKDLYYLRYMAYTIVFYDELATFELTSSLIQSPLQFLEFIQFCATCSSLIVSHLSHSRNLSKAFSKGFVILQEIDAAHTEGIEEMRAKALSYLLVILKQMPIANTFFSDVTFSVSWLYFAYEAPLRTVIFGEVLDYLIKTDNYNQMTLVQDITNIMTIAKLELKKDETVIYIKGILELLINVLKENPKHKATFSDISSSIMQVFEFLVPTDSCRNLLVTIIRFFSSLLPVYQLSAHNMESISLAISTLNEAPSDALKDVLLNLLVGKEATKEESPKSIQQAKAAGVLLKTYKNTEYIIDITKTLIELCNFSNQNCVKMHDDEIDILVLDLIISLWDFDDEKSVEKIKCFFELFVIIDKVASSAVAVLRFISLLCPFEGKYVSKHIFMVINILKNMLNLNLLMPDTYTPITSKTLLSPISSIPTKNGMTLIMWLKKERRAIEYPSNVFNIKSGDSSFSLFLNSGFLSVFTSSKGYGKVTQLEELDDNRWTLISLSLVNKGEDKTEIIIETENNKYVKTADISIDQPSKVTFCGMVEGVQDPAHPNLLGPFAIFPLLSEETIKEVKKNGYRNFGSVMPRLFYTIQNFSMKAEKEQTFANVFLHICKVDSILPLLCFPEITFKDGTKVENLINDTLDILTLSLSFGENVEKSFLESHGFAIIHHILSKHPASILTYELYLKFYSILGVIQNCELKDQLIRSILFNMQLWIICEPDVQTKIQRHWIVNLFPNYNSIIIASLSFSDIFASMINSYTSYGTKKRHPPPSCDLKAMRSTIYQLLISIAPFSFGFDDFVAIVSFCDQVANKETSIEVLNIFKQLALVTPSPFTEIMKRPEALPLMYNFLNTNSGLIAGAVFDCISFMYKTGIIQNPPLLEQSIAMLSRVHAEAYDHNLFYAVSEITTNVTIELFPVCCIIALRIGSKECIELVSNAKPMNDFPRPYWSVFPLLLYRQLSTEAFDDLSDFIVKCGPDDWIKVFNSIELIGWFYSSAKDSLHLSFIKSLMKSIKAENIAPNQPRFGQFIYIVARFLFFRENNQCNTALLCQIQSEAPDFVELQSLVNFFKSNRKVSLHIDDNNFTVGDYFTLFIRGAEEQRKSCFGLRFDQNGVWLDKELAIACVRVIIKSRCAIGLMTVMIVCALLAKSNDDFIKEIVPQIDINPQKDGEKVLEVANFLFFKLFLVKKHNLFKYKPTGQSFGNEAIPFFCETCNIQSASPVTVAKEIKSLWLSSQAISEKLHNTLSDFSYQSRALFVEQAQIDYNKWCENNNKIWRHAWGYMTLEKAPWENAVPYHRHYMRDSTLCFAKCPFKLKPNWEFNDHVVASKARDEMKGSEKRMVLKRTESWAKSVSVLIKQQEPTKVLYSTKCTVVKVSHSTSASFDMHLHDFTITYSETHIHTYEYSSISAVSNQTHLHHQNSIEIFFTNDHSLFVVFEKTEERNQAVKIFQSKIKTFLQHALSELPGEKMNLWQKGKISNFEYLMYLNRLSGRTFLNPLQYPILPWILTDYTSSELNLNDPSIFRDLSKPVGALNEERLKAIEATEFDLGQTDGLYSNAMGCTLTLYIMMIRVEPFTTLHIQMQSGRFDVSDRIFTSIKQLYDTAMTNTNDVKELIPEFFFMPEMLLNLNNFDLGFTGKGNAGDVILPPWAKSAVEFVYLHRKALESDYVSQNINNWIDLIWGYKQRGSKAVEEKNNFSSMLYDDIWTPENLNDPKMKAQIEAAKTYLGQIPLQLFTSPHPQRDVEKEERVVLKSYRFKAPTSKLLFATIEQEKLQEIAVTFINEEGVLSKFYCKLSEGDDSSVSTSSVGSEPQVQILDTTDQQVTAFGLLPGNIILTFGRNINMYDANTGQLTPFGDSLQCWDIAGEWLAIVGVDSILKVYNAKNLKTPLCMTPFQRDLARCCCISPEFHVVVVASRDGGVVVHALETGFSIHSINLGVCMPQKVIVTPSWGFIVIYLTRIEENKLVHVLSVYTINGLFVREARVLSPISKMTCWKSPKGFDYIAISSERGSISTSEVFYLDFGKPMFRFQSSLVALKFNEKMGTLIAVSDDGKIFSEYYSYSNADKK